MPCLHTEMADRNSLLRRRPYTNPNAPRAQGRGWLQQWRPQVTLQEPMADEIFPDCPSQILRQEFQSRCMSSIFSLCWNGRASLGCSVSQTSHLSVSGERFPLGVTSSGMFWESPGKARVYVVDLQTWWIPICPWAVIQEKVRWWVLRDPVQKQPWLDIGIIYLGADAGWLHNWNLWKVHLFWQGKWEMSQ